MDHSNNYQIKNSKNLLYSSLSCLQLNLGIKAEDVHHSFFYSGNLNYKSQNFNPAPAPNSNITQTNYPSLSQPLTIKRNETNLLLWKNQLLNVIIANWLEDFIEGDMPIRQIFL
ncbi:hypothetical protein CK203_087796 [Vitis vinifera]|uniref:Uncharacterized protein n=1 Tax=Vitis vinifera TaxID=29760 RepID=A0A438CVC1_VITVI|nr:hypothetical protein CK203_087796 [Vitis vinifera]